MAKLVTFDCYGTLIDTDPYYKAVGEAGKKVGVDAGKMLKTYIDIQERVMYGEPLTFFNDLILRVLEYCEMELNCNGLTAQYDSLRSVLHSVQPFPEVNETLAALKQKGCKIAIMSNSVIDIMKHHIAALGTEFDGVYLAEEMYCYKPRIEFFIRTAEKVGIKIDNHVHVAAGYWWDIIPARQLGWNRIWVNRSNQRGNERDQPFTEVKTLDQILQYI